MIEKSSEQFLVAQAIQESLGNLYNILLNVDDEKHFIGNVFPDIILLDKKVNTPLFVIEIRRNGKIASCMQQWKSHPKIAATLYFVVPQVDLENAKSIAAVSGINAKFGYYTIEGGKANVIFE